GGVFQRGRWRGLGPGRPCGSRPTRRGPALGGAARNHGPGAYAAGGRAIARRPARPGEGGRSIRGPIVTAVVTKRGDGPIVGGPPRPVRPGHVRYTLTGEERKPLNPF